MNAPPVTRDAAVRTGVVLRGVTRRYGDQIVFADLDLTLPEGEITALAGSNGSGKTTVARLLLGLDTPDAGTIDGLDGRRVAAVFQEDRLCGHLTAISNVRMALERSEWPRVEDELRLVGLDAEALAKPVRELSGGQRRRVAIVRALVTDADLMVLDEPFTGLDAKAKPAIMRYVRERLAGRTTLLITHIPAEAKALGAKVVRLRG